MVKMIIKENQKCGVVGRWNVEAVEDLGEALYWASFKAVE